jgi:hypothetical protein
MCKDSEVRHRKEMAARRKDTRTLKMISQNLELDPPRSSISESEPSSEAETEALRQIRHNRMFAEFLHG